MATSDPNNLSNQSTYLVNVHNLNGTTKENILFHHFKDFGPIIGKVSIKTKNGKVVGFVNYQSLEDAKEAHRQMNNKIIDGSVITTSLPAIKNTGESIDFQKLTDCTFFKQGKCTKGSVSKIFNNIIYS